ncbi:MAG: DNA topoisomerase IB [Janthinobacterium lividum]
MLSYVDAREPGFTRRKRGQHWHYFDVDGRRITDAGEIARLNKLGVPPAYARVWFSPDPDGHLQAVGYDAKGRRQYRYHEEFRSARESDKYDRCGSFGAALPRLRAVVDEEIAARGLGRRKVLAAIVRLLDHGHIRVGNDVYAAQNNSYGATTLLHEHSKVRGDRVKLEYRGKSGKMQRVVIADASLAKIVRRCHDLPGQALFQYVGADGEPHRIGSADVNAYIKDAMAGDFSAKHFRTWGASVIAFETIVAADPATLTLKLMLEPVAAALGNTPAISRKSYVHPSLIELVSKGRAADLAGAKLPRATRHLSASERGLIAFLAGDAAAEKFVEDD